MSSYQFDIQALNDIVVDDGGAGGFTYQIDAINAWAILAGGVGGHTYNIDGYNELVGLLGGAGAPFTRNIDALNSISLAVGGTGGYRFDIDALNELAELQTGGVPLAPILTWVSDNTVNPPQLDADFDDTHVWASGDIDASNYDVIERQYDTDSAFGSVDDDATHTVDATDLLNGSADLSGGTPWPIGVPVYARVRHHHYVNGAAHTSAWSNTVTQTLTASDDEDYAAWMAAA